MSATATSSSPAQSYSQWGEDRLVWEHFGRRDFGTFLEAGALHPSNLSQTYFLEKKGWHGVLVEPVTDLAAEFMRLRPRSKLFHLALGGPEDAGKELAFVVPNNDSLAHLLEPGEKPGADATIIRVRLTTLSAVLAESGLEKLDYLSLDLEGHELPALRGLDFDRWKPALILIEDHLHDLKKHRYLQSRGYELVFRTGSNNWYVPTGTPCGLSTPAIKWELFRKLYLSMPFRKLRISLKTMRGLQP